MPLPPISSKVHRSDSPIINFRRLTKFGTFSNPLSAELANDFDKAREGVVQKIYHQSDPEPIFPENWVLIGSGTYQAGQLNLIFCEWELGERVEYWINQPAS